MRFAAHLDTDDDLGKAVHLSAERIRHRMDGRSADLVVAFVTSGHRAVWDALPGLLADAFPGATRVGCSGGGALAGGREIEGKPAVAVVAASLPDVEVAPVRIPATLGASPEAAAALWSKRLNGLGSPSAMLLLPDPFSCHASHLVEGLDLALPGVVAVGGLASGGRTKGENLLFADGELFSDGGVAVALSGRVRVDTIVAQGCRPVGQPMFVTGCDGHVISELDGRRPADVLHELFESLSPRDQELLRYALFLGVVMRERESVYRHGDFLIRNIEGFDPESGALLAAASLRPGQVIQFHLRDAHTSADDLQGHLDEYVASSAPRPAGALLFSCLGRGVHLYGQPDFDSQTFLRTIGDVPLAGFFCNGEIGPVQGTTFVHGYTSAFALFSEPGLSG